MKVLVSGFTNELSKLMILYVVNALIAYDWDSTALAYPFLIRNYFPLNDLRIPLKFNGIVSCLTCWSLSFDEAIDTTSFLASSP